MRVDVDFVMHMEQAGGAPAEQRGKYVVVYRREAAGGWKAVADMFSSNG